MKVKNNYLGKKRQVLEDCWCLWELGKERGTAGPQGQWYVKWWGPRSPLFLPLLSLGISIIFSHLRVASSQGRWARPPLSGGSYPICHHWRNSSQSSSSNTPMAGHIEHTCRPSSALGCPLRRPLWWAELPSRSVLPMVCPPAEKGLLGPVSRCGAILPKGTITVDLGPLSDGPALTPPTFHSRPWVSQIPSAVTA